VSAGSSSLALRKRRWLRPLAFPLLVVPCLIAANRAAVWVAEYVSASPIEKLPPTKPQGVIDVLESPLNLGEVPVGGQKQGKFSLTNRSAAPVEVAEIETSCDCLTIDLANRVLSPGQRVVGRALLDLHKEPGFTGKLSIDVTGKGQSGQGVFTLAVKVAVDGQ
jgi:Protein of unknown function (DUF1573)